jgi:Ca2+:H+ antiporter
MSSPGRSATDSPGRFRSAFRDAVTGRLAPPALLIYAAFALTFGSSAAKLPVLGTALPIFEILMLMLAVAIAVHHAEEIAHSLGEPYGTLVLTMAVTIIECALILAVMLSGKGNATLARDTVFSVIMLVVNGLVGACFLIGGIRWGEQTFRSTSARAYLMMLLPFGVLTMVLPGFTTTAAGPFYSAAQIVFVSIVTLALYGTFLYVQTVRHKGFFDVERVVEEVAAEDAPAPTPNAIHYTLLAVTLVAIVLLAKSFAASIEAGVAAIGAPHGIVGVLVAALVLLPESVAAIQAARDDQLQRSINLALGSSLATIGLTFPAVGMLSLFLGTPLVLGLGPTEMILLALTLTLAMVTISGGRTNILSGSVHLVLLATFVFLIFVP